MITSQTQPVSAGHSITISHGYDLDGNQTALTDGNGNTTYTTYNPLGLPQAFTEPPTAQYSSAAGSQTTDSYDSDGNLVTQDLPGGVQITDSYDSMGDLTSQSGTGATAPTATRTYTYDLAGRMLTASTSAAGSQVAVIHTTSSHLFWDATTSRWTKAGALKDGTRLRVASGTAAVVLGGYVPAASSGEMWDLTTLNNHDFYVVTGGTPVLVHNDGGPFWRGYKPGEEITFTGRPGIDFQVNPETGFVKPGRGPSITTDPGSLGKYGRVGAEVHTSTVPSELEIVQKGKPGRERVAKAFLSLLALLGAYHNDTTGNTGQ
jgi:YD repeat-containing protein